MSIRPAPQNWRRRMGIAVLFLLVLDALILAGPYSGFRVALATTVSILVLISIALIWRRNTKLERLVRENPASR